MALQDLTPQLRTRLSRMERAVGLFVLLAAALLACGFFYYIYTTAERKGWFKIKASYFTFTDRATGLKVGDPVQLMGFDVGQITKIDAQPPYDQYEVYVRFEIKEPYYDYLWTVGSLAKVKTADLLGKRVLEVTKGTAGHATYLFNPLTEIQTSEAQTLPELENWRLGQDIYDQAGTNLILQAGWPLSTNVNTLTALGIQRVRVVDARKAQKKKTITALWNDQEGRYDPFYKTNFYWLKSNESPAVTDRLEALIDQVEKALPNILTLTNQLANVLSNSASLTSNLNVVATDVRPVVSHLAAATAQLDHAGALGEWLLPTNINHQLEGTLGSADATLTSVNTNLTALVENLGRSLDNLANLTSNLNGQVSANTNILSEVSRVVVNTDDLVQGLKRHWLLRSAFKTKTKPPGPAPPPPKEKSGK
jgi:ABC-type transporter Mla subunit MlaD